MRARNKLSVAYEGGKCIYPRVFNNYIEVTNFFEHPHPPLARFDEFSYPLAKDFYPFTKEFSAIELTNFQISTPATLFSNLEMIDEYFDAKLQPRIIKSKIMSEKLDGFYEHLSDLYAQFGDSVYDGSGKLNVNRLVKDGVVSHFNMDITPFRIRLSPSPSNKSSSEKNKRSKIRDDIANFSDEVSQKKIAVSSIEEAHLLYRRKRLIMKRLQEKKELAYRIAFGK